MPKKQPTQASINFGKFIEAEIKKQGLTMYSVAKNTYLSESTLNNVVKGIDIHMSTFYTIINALGLKKIDIIDFINQNRYA